MRSLIKAVLSLVFLSLLSTSFLLANTATNGGVIQAMKSAQSNLNVLKNDLAGYPNDSIVKASVYKLNDRYVKGALRQSARALDSFGGEAYRIGQEIQQICIMQKRDQKRIWNWGTDVDATALRDEVTVKIDETLSRIDTFIKEYKPVEAPVADDDQPSTGDDDDDDDDEVTTNNGPAVEVPNHGNMELIGTLETQAIGQSKPDAEQGTDGVQHSYSTYTVKRGDSLWKIADKLAKDLGVPREQLIAAIEKANYIGGKGYIYEGQELRVPVLTGLNGEKLSGATAETALAQWQQQYEDKRAFAGADGNTDDYAKDITVELRQELHKAYDKFYDLGSRFAQCQEDDEEARIALIHDVRSQASTYVVWARRRYQMLKDQIRNMPEGDQKTKAKSYLKRLATVGRCADNLQYAKASGWRFDFCNQQVADLLGAAGGA